MTKIQKHEVDAKVEQNNIYVMLRLEFVATGNRKDKSRACMAYAFRTAGRIMDSWLLEGLDYCRPEVLQGFGENKNTLVYWVKFEMPNQSEIEFDLYGKAVRAEAANINEIL